VIPEPNLVISLEGPTELKNDPFEKELSKLRELGIDYSNQSSKDVSE
jgi:hypothetical protein